jgi:hypothetical protein
MEIVRWFKNSMANSDALREAAGVADFRVARSLLGPAFRGLIQRAGKGKDISRVRSRYDVQFSWNYASTHAEMAALYDRAKRGQWDPDTGIHWEQLSNEAGRERAVIDAQLCPLQNVPAFHKLPPSLQQQHRLDVLAWILSQFLHGEQGALMAAAQVTTAVPWMDGKLYGATQVMDEGRHVEVFHRYLTRRLEKLYEINDNLYVILDALMTDARWDIKFLGMQIMVEGLALGAFGAIRAATGDPLLQQLLDFVVADEARHVHFGVLALREHYREALSSSERHEREDWAFEMAVLMRNRFMAHEFYEEHYAHVMTRRAWDRAVLQSGLIRSFQQAMLRQIMPNLERIGLLPDRMRPHWDTLAVH